MSEWISVEDRLPKKDQHVWVAILFKYSNAPSQHQVSQAFYQGWRWRDVHSDNYIHPPTHWQPFIRPEPPK